MANPILSTTSGGDLLVADENTGSRNLKIKLEVPGEVIEAVDGEDGEDSTVPGPEGKESVEVFTVITTGDSAPATPTVTTIDFTQRSLPIGTDIVNSIWTQTVPTKTNNQDIWVARVRYDHENNRIDGSWDAPKIISGPKGDTGKMALPRQK